MEVLKAIQKAKEVRSKLSNPEKKVSLCVGAGRRGGEEPAGEGAGLQWNWAREPSRPGSPGCTPRTPGCMTLGFHARSVLVCEMGGHDRTCCMGLLRVG